MAYFISNTSYLDGGGGCGVGTALGQFFHQTHLRGHVQPSSNLTKLIESPPDTAMPPQLRYCPLVSALFNLKIVMCALN